MSDDTIPVGTRVIVVRSPRHPELLGKVGVVVGERGTRYDPTWHVQCDDCYVIDFPGGPGWWMRHGTVRRCEPAR